jgi:hypothetical protein
VERAKGRTNLIRPGELIGDNRAKPRFRISRQEAGQIISGAGIKHIGGILQVEQVPTDTVVDAIESIAPVADRPEAGIGEVGGGTRRVNPGYIFQLAVGLQDGMRRPVGAIGAGGNIALFPRGYENAVPVGHAEQPVWPQIGWWRLQMPRGSVSAGIKRPVVTDGHHQV